MKEKQNKLFIFFGFVAGTYVGSAVLAFFILPQGTERIIDIRLLFQRTQVHTLQLTFVVLGTFGFLGALGAYTFGFSRVLKESLRKLKESREINRTKDEFISMVLHHLRTPLSGIKWSLKQMLKEEVTLSEVKTRLQSLSDENNRALNAVEHLIEASQASMGRITYNFEIIGVKTLQHLIQEAIDGFIPMAQEKNLSVAIEMSPASNSSIKIDKEKIIIVAQMLFDNAIRYTLAKGRVTIRTEEKEANFFFSIMDTGIGIPEKDQPRIFLQFFRSENTRRLDPSGFGIGLYLIRIFIESHQGKIWFTSKEGKGTTFTFNLPIIKAPTEKFLEEIG